MSLIWSAWNNGNHNRSGAGYGLKVPIADRNRYFKRSWESVILELPASDGFAEVSLNINKSSFWNDTCHELISQEIGLWLRNSGLAPWPSRQPPKFAVEINGDKHFRVLGIAGNEGRKRHY